MNRCWANSDDPSKNRREGRQGERLQRGDPAIVAGSIPAMESDRHRRRFFTQNPSGARHHCWIQFCYVGAAHTPARSHGTCAAQLVAFTGQLEAVRR